MKKADGISISTYRAHLADRPRSVEMRTEDLPSFMLSDPGGNADVCLNALPGTGISG